MQNVYKITLGEVDCTNNYCEGWINSFRQTLGHDHPSIWKLIDHFKDDAAMAITHLFQTSHGHMPKKRQRKCTRNLQEKLFNLCLQRSNQTISIEGFLHGIGHSI